MTEKIKQIEQQAYAATKELMEKAELKSGQILVVGCSTSEVCGAGIGTYSSPEVAEGLFAGIHQAAKEQGIFLAAQCCEHLNRAIVTELSAVLSAETVNVVPQPKAGGSLATQAYTNFHSPVVVEEIKADRHKPVLIN